MTKAGGRPASCSVVARSGDAVIWARSAASVVYWSQNHCMPSRRRKYPVANWWYEPVSKFASVTG
jgi:hypothetical protein